MDKGLTWLHLSDLHFRRGDEYYRLVVLNGLLTDVASLIEEKQLALDCVFITGDIAFSGSAEEYDLAQNFITRLSSVSGVPLARIFTVPGNHDIDRTLQTQLTGFVSRTLASRDIVSSVIGTPEQLVLFTAQHTAYSQFIKSTFPWASAFTDDQLWFAHTLNVNNTKASIIGLNSAWLVSPDTEGKGRIIVGERQVRDALRAVDEPGSLIICLMHHPLSYLAEFDAHDVEPIINGRSDFVLHGHIHATGVLALASPDSEVFHFAAGATYIDRNETLSYNCVAVDFATGKAKVYLRRFSDIGGGFWAPDTLMYKSAPNGELEVSLPERLSHQPQRLNFADLALKLQVLTPSNIPGPSIARMEQAAPKPPPSLVSEILTGRCILFAGAGASIDAKLPTWHELILDLIEEVKNAGTADLEEVEEIKQLLEDGELLVLADFLRRRLGEYDFANYLARRLSDSTRASRTHRLLAQIPFRAAMTSNYDPFLEHARPRAQVILPDEMERIGAPGIQRILSDDAVFPVIKIHGSFESPPSIVLTHSSFRQLLFNKPRYREFLSQLLTDTTMFFYGYSFRDPNVDLALQQVVSVYSGATKPHYALLPNPGRIKIQHLRENYNVRVIPYEVSEGAHIAASEFLENLNELFVGKDAL